MRKLTYSFSTVELRPVVRSEIDRARELLELGGSASVSEIKRTYRRLAHKLHPDAPSAGRDGNGDTQFARIEEASGLLMSYCRAQLRGREGGGCPLEEERCSFEPDAVDETLLLSIGPAGGDSL